MGLGLGLLVLLSEARISEGYGKLFERCTKEKNAFDCLKKRALDILDNAIKDDADLVVNDYISIGKDANVAKSIKLHTDENSTKRSLDDELDKKLSDYISSRSIKLTIPGDAFEG